MKKLLKRISMVLISILAVTALTIGGYKIMKQIEHDEMIKIVKSEEVKKIIEDYLNHIDKKALTNGGVIQSYKIDEKSIQHNPIGGINFSVYVNGNSELYIRYTLEKNSKTDKISFSNGGYSGELQRLVREKK